MLFHDRLRYRRAVSLHIFSGKQLSSLKDKSRYVSAVSEGEIASDFSLSQLPFRIKVESLAGEEPVKYLL